MIPADAVTRFTKSSERMPRSPNSFLLLLSVVFVLATFAATGCSAFRGVNEYIQYNDDTNDTVIGVRNGIKAHLAWYDYRSEFSDEPHMSTFGAGFRDGYKNVASGGDGCPPPVPPRKYWNWKYQSEKGQAKVAAWFAGFPYGAIVAEEKGLGAYGEIQVSDPIKIQYSPEFQTGGVSEIEIELRPQEEKQLEKQLEEIENETPPLPNSVRHLDAQHSSFGSRSQSVEEPAQEFLLPIKKNISGDKVKDKKRL